MNSKTGVWLGLRRCGCPIAVMVDDEAIPKKDIEKSKREFLREGLSVVYATWDDWLTLYRPKFLRDCEHERAAREAVGEPVTVAAVDPARASSHEPTTREK